MGWRLDSPAPGNPQSPGHERGAGLACRKWSWDREWGTGDGGGGKSPLAWAPPGGPCGGGRGSTSVLPTGAADGPVPSGFVPCSSRCPLGLSLPGTLCWAQLCPVYLRSRMVQGEGPRAEGAGAPGPGGGKASTVHREGPHSTGDSLLQGGSSLLSRGRAKDLQVSSRSDQ